MGAEGQDLGAVLHQSRDVELHLVKEELAGLYSGKIQDVVDKRHEGVSGRADHAEVLRLVRVDGRLGQEVGHADDGVHGRANLVAHAGQELGLGPGGFQGGVPGSPKLLFGFLPFGELGFNRIPEVRAHLVEGPGQLPELIVALDGYGVVQVSAADHPGALGQGSQRPGDAPCDHPGRDDNQYEKGGRCPHDAPTMPQRIWEISARASSAGTSTPTPHPRDGSGAYAPTTGVPVKSLYSRPVAPAPPEASSSPAATTTFSVLGRSLDGVRTSASSFTRYTLPRSPSPASGESVSYGGTGEASRMTWATIRSPSVMGADTIAGGKAAPGT